ncbi:MAG TPA: hypothetical protein VMG12_10025 [Polyangiaceae bacterium]|nr:hypothetical protein [Polyangiaceae bacterium]
MTSDAGAVDAASADLAERVRTALIERALQAHEDARLQGLCMEGAWEAAVSAMRALDVAALALRGGGLSAHLPPRQP